MIYVEDVLSIFSEIKLFPEYLPKDNKTGKVTIIVRQFNLLCF